MKALQLHTALLFGLVWAWKVQAVTSQGWFNDFLDDIDFGGNNGGGNNNFDIDVDLQEVDAKLNEKMGYILNLAGLQYDQASLGDNMIFAGTQSGAFDRQTQGKRVFDCMGTIGNFNEDKLPKFDSLRSMLYGQLFDVYETIERIDVLCAAAQQRQQQRVRRQLRARQSSFIKSMINPGAGPRGSEMHSVSRRTRGANLHGNNHRHLNLDPRRDVTRKLQMANTPNYPSTRSAEYNAWAQANVQQFIESGDLTDRPSPELLVDDIMNPLSIASTAYTGLVVAETAVDVVCNIVGIVEFGFDPGDFCRIISSAIGVVAFLQGFVVSSFEGDMENWELHNRLIDSAEIEATYLNTQN